MELKNKINYLYFDNPLLEKFIKILTKKGKKSTINATFLKIIKYIKTQKNDIDPLTLIITAIENVKPLVEVKTVKRRHVSTQVPFEISQTRQETLAMRWIIHSARNRNGKTFWLKLASELIDAYNNQGSSIKRKKEMHKLAVIQKRFLHFYK